MGSINPDRHPNDTLGYMADNGWEIDVHCPGCDRRERIVPNWLAKRYGYYRDYRSIAHMLKCRRCDRKGMEVRRVKWSEGVPRGWRPGDR